MDVTMADLLKRGLSRKEAAMALEAISSCGIEGIIVKDEEALDRLCKLFKGGQ